MSTFILYTLFLLTSPNEDLSTTERYFLECKTENKMFLDRRSNSNIISIAATGFGIDCLAIMASESKIPRENVIQDLNEMLDYVQKITPKETRGWLYHWLNKDGTPAFNKEVSTIDTAIFYAGARQAARRLGDRATIDRVEALISNIDVKWLMGQNGYIRHGFYLDNGIISFIPYEWENYSEGLIIYKTFKLPYKPKEIVYNLPLFCYYYPMCFYNDDFLMENLKKAIEYQQKSLGYWGVTSTDTENGYTFFDSEVVSPQAIYTIKKILGESHLTPSGVQAYNKRTGWESKDSIGIDEGASYILLKGW